MKTREQVIAADLNELGDWRATFPGRTAEQVCREWGYTQRKLDRAIKERDELKAQLEAAQKACAEWREEMDTIRDCVLHNRGPLAEMYVDSDIINAVLGIIDSHTPDSDAGKDFVPKAELDKIKEQVKPLVDALTRIYKGPPATGPRVASWQIAEQALAHAKKLGIEP